MIEKKMPAVRQNIKLILGPILFVVTCLVLVLFQKDVGQTMLILIIFSQLFYSGIGVQNMLKWGLLVALGFVIIASFMLILHMVPSYLEARFSTLTNPFGQESEQGIIFLIP